MESNWINPFKDVQKRVFIKQKRWTWALCAREKERLVNSVQLSFLDGKFHKLQSLVPFFNKFKVIIFHNSARS
jgi:hypothetical protein